MRVQVPGLSLIKASSIGLMKSKVSGSREQFKLHRIAESRYLLAATLRAH